MNHVVRQRAVFLLSSQTVQSMLDCGLYRVCGPESITASCLSAAGAFARVLEDRKPSSLAAKLAGEFFANAAGRALLGAADGDFQRMAERAFDQATEIESQLNAEDVPAVAETVPAEQDPSDEPKASDGPAAAKPAEPVSNVEPTPAAGQVDVPASVQVKTTEADPAAEQSSELATKPDDVPVEELAKKGIPEKVIEVLVAAGLTTAKAVRDRDAATQITDLTDIGPAIRKKILAAVDEAIA